MLMEKLSRGVLRLQTPLGPRYVAPTFWHRVYLLWLFRNFESLPPQVLTQRQLRFIEEICEAQASYANPASTGFELPILGTLESRPAASGLEPGSKSESVSPFATDSGSR
ncbi:MAG: hypothetical protein H0X25_19965 [Acidobacteriales bacterium]|nr:hypothetical protein [Terriglobales bacterium]